jgi:hypothetical protein
MEKQEKLFNRATKLAGSEEIAKLLMEDVKGIVENFAKEHGELLNRSLDLLRTKIESHTLGFTNETRKELLSAIDTGLVEEIMSYLLISAAGYSVTLQMRCADFMYKAASIWEMAATHIAISQMKSGIMEMALKLRPEQPKDHMS